MKLITYNTKILILMYLSLYLIICFASKHIYAQSEALEYLISLQDIEVNPEMLEINATIHRSLYYIGEPANIIKRTAIYMDQIDKESIPVPDESLLEDDTPVGFFCTFFALIGFIIGVCFDELVVKYLFDPAFIDAYQYTHKINATSNELINDLIVTDIDILHAYMDIRNIDRAYTAIEGTFEEFYRRYNNCFLQCDFDRISLSRYWHEAQILYRWQGWYFQHFLDSLSDIHWFLKYVRSLSMLRRNQIYNLDYFRDQHDSFIWPRDIENFQLGALFQLTSYVGLECM